MTIRYGSVCSGVEAATLAWEPLGWECRFVAEVEPFPCAVLQERLGATRPLHPLDPAEAGNDKDKKEREKWIKQLEHLKEEGRLVNEGDFTKIGDKYRGQLDVLCGGTPCFVAGTQVLTPNGYVPIETLQVGDEVVSSSGDVRTVTAIGSKKATVGRFKVLGRPELLCTGNHPFLCIEAKTDYSRGSATYSRKIPVGDYQKTRADEAVGKYVGRPLFKACKCPTFPTVYTASERQIMELVGWWLGDGYIRRFKTSNKKTVVIALGSPHKLAKFISIFTGCLNFSVSADNRVSICCTSLADWLLDNFGEYSYGKRIPYWCYTHEHKDALLSGYRATDGHSSDKQDKYLTTSAALAYGVADLIGGSSVSFTKMPEDHVIEGRLVKQRDVYCVHQYKNGTVRTREMKGRYASIARGFKNAGEDIVYNITVDVDHTYVANGLATFNCQDLSVAGKREGLAGERSSLAVDFIQLAYISESPVVLWENVPGALSSNNGKDFATLLSLFTGRDVGVPDKGWGNAGFVCNDRPDRYGVSWRILDSQFTRTPGFPFAIPQRRRRLFVVGCLGDWSAATRILLEPGRNDWNAPTRFRARKKFANFACQDFRRTNETLRKVDGVGEETVEGTTVRSIGNGQADSLVNPPEIAQTLNCMHDQQAIMITADADILCRAGDNTNSEYGDNLCTTIKANANRNTPVLCVNDQGGKICHIDEELAGTLRASAHGNDPILCAPTEDEFIAYENHPADSRVTEMGDACQTLSSRMGTGGGNLPYVQRRGSMFGFFGGLTSYVRRLLPVEAEMLMGFPRLWTKISWLGKPASECPKAPRYKCCGNSMCVNVMEWLGMMINEYLKELKGE